jgi:hypothetical protein
MTPIDFVVFDGDSEPNTPAYAIAEAMRQPLRIVSASKNWEVCSYYYDEGQMVLEIKTAEGTK